MNNLDYEKFLSDAFVVRPVDFDESVNMTRLLATIDYKYEPFLHYLTKKKGFVWRIEFSDNNGEKCIVLGDDTNSTVINGEWIVSLSECRQPTTTLNAKHKLTVEPCVSRLNTGPVPQLMIHLIYDSVAENTEKRESAAYIRRCHQDFLNDLFGFQCPKF